MNSGLKSGGSARQQRPCLSQVEVTALKGVGKQLAQKLGRLQIHTVQDLLFHLPLRYMDRTRVTPIGAVAPLANVVIEGEIKACDVVYGKRRSLMCRLQDGTGTITLRFFHFSGAQKKRLQPGVKLRCFGESRRGASGLELYHPEYDYLDADQPIALEARLTPVYPATDGVTQQRLRSLTEQALALIDDYSLQELIPDDAWRRQPYPLREALEYLHHPPKEAPIDKLLEGTHPFQQRLAFEELLAHHLSMLRIRQRIQAAGATALAPVPDLQRRFLQQLGFSLTGAQARVSAEISADLSRPVPMLRLVQGDVGSGKTVVAALAAIQAVGNGMQAAIMAPTEILAEQHRASFTRWLEPLGISVGWLSGKQKATERREQLTAIESGEVQVVVGTHALFQEEVRFSHLGLTIIDEQHRFGVDQRLALRNKASDGGRSHQLIMTATPIPRTLAMSVYADLDCSVINELPPGRTPVKTVAISQERRQQVIERVHAACQEGRQAYWVCTLIEESEVLEAQAAEAVTDALRNLLPDVGIGLVHGRMKAAEKDQQMRAFKTGELQLLVATTVIEVGVDVPNASLMIIENPERLGLAQLHQLRGRVGRGSAESHCVLLHGAPLSNQGRERLTAMRETSDGFVIAEKDLQLRGPGEVLGTRQTGEVQFRLADLQRDGHLLPRIKEVASYILTSHSDVVDALILRWLGDSENYASV
ncbi:ATP-dependent DNA helicase RecG [Pseudomaricurvus alkylphenolicus]|jgi:ATP-dependent DNA helicase RecG|uniref:ATP-dependent DNA helicase RecG n=1 Tax=Pseudomaricurvus alkylphenolicus TaxID=1306991 RepID=UPI001420C43C|nr:ATP-dependent DNA helicase RecG [Pseudomaricurvus alkylphenolicus]NIB39452.1 ATP-dependent DNA helicase RecG [Pseudomaricurvus alkylphenolicus]